MPGFSWSDKEVAEAFEDAFRSMGGGCCRECQCGTEYYNSGGGWGWDDGELEDLAANPNAVDIPYAVDTVEIFGREFVVGCGCLWSGNYGRQARWIADFLINRIEGVSRFIEKYLDEISAEEALLAAGIERMQPPEQRGAGYWRDMASAPRDSSWIQVLSGCGKVEIGHYACDLSGGDQPPYRGWFKAPAEPGGAYIQIEAPAGWRPIPVTLEERKLNRDL